MHFGRTQTLPADLTLPPNAPRTEAFLRLRWEGQGHLHIGAPIWVAKSWVGGLYPDDTKATEYLTAYAEQLNTVELSSTFYQQVGPERIASWAQRVPTTFRFCPKVYRGITEQLGSPTLPDLVRVCATEFAAFGERYGLGIAQFNESFGPRDLPLLERFLKLWPQALPLAVEFRHPGWFADHALQDEAVNLLYRHKAVAVITDTPGRRDALHLSLTQPKVLVRFLGVEDPKVDRQRLDQWAERLLEWTQSRLSDLYVFCHQPNDEAIPDTVNMLLRSLQMRGVSEPSPWRPQRRVVSRSLFRDEGAEGPAL